MFAKVIWDPAIGIDLGFFMIRYYSLMFVIAFSLGFYIMKRIFVEDKISMEKLDPLFIYVVVATLLGARIGHFLFYDIDFLIRKPLEVILPFQFNPFKFVGFSGLASHGAALAVIIAMYFYSRKHLGKNILYILDRISIPVAIGGAFVRLGNLMNSEIIGKPTGSDYGFVFKKLGEDFTRYPTQIYEAISYFILFFILAYLYLKTDSKKHVGFIFGVFMVLLWTIRFVIEFYKEWQGGIESTFNLNLNTGQLLSIPLVLVGFIIMYFSRRK